MESHYGLICATLNFSMHNCMWQRSENAILICTVSIKSLHTPVEMPGFAEGKKGGQDK